MRTCKQAEKNLEFDIRQFSFLKVLAFFKTVLTPLEPEKYDGYVGIFVFFVFRFGKPMRACKNAEKKEPFSPLLLLAACRTSEFFGSPHDLWLRIIL